MSDYDWQPGPVPGSAAVWHAETTVGQFEIRLYVSPDSDGCDCEECTDSAPECAHAVCVVAVEAWLAGVMLAQTGVGQTGFEGGVPGEDVDETAAMLVREMVREARSTLRQLTAPDVGYSGGGLILDAGDMAVTRASRHLPGDLDAGLMPGTELAGVRVTAWREGGALQVDVLLEDADGTAWKTGDGHLGVRVTVAGSTVHQGAHELPAARSGRGSTVGDGKG
jgi:hypothetical protein